MTRAEHFCITPAGHRALRLVLLAWFTGVTAQALPWPQGQVLAQLLFPGDLGFFGFNATVFALAWAMSLGPDLRLPALYLSLIVAWAAVLSKISGAPVTPQAYWRDVALLAGLLLTQLPVKRPISTDPTEPDCRPRLVHHGGEVIHLHPSGACDATGRAAFAESPDDMASSFARALEAK
ncbi:hypothetical protein [Aliiroseovarius sp.]|uniref:hypothetical protein n=1 Tax=Aliiroseovarius sp. TaxID=1872442 RepID=UPI003BAA79AE